MEAKTKTTTIDMESNSLMHRQAYALIQFIPKIYLALLFLIFLTTYSPTQAGAGPQTYNCDKLLTKTDGQRFRIFKEPWVLGKPFEGLTPDPQAAIEAWQSHCLEEIDVWYGAALQTTDKQATIPFARLSKHARERPLKGDIRVIDVESWPIQGDLATMAGSRAKYTDLFWSVKSLSESKVVGFYNFPPVPDYWRIKAGIGAQKFREWQKDNDFYRSLAAAVDAFFPSLYTVFEENIAAWRETTDPKLAEIERYRQNKPVIPFIMPYYHEGNRKKGGTEIDSDFLQGQIEYLFNSTDGVIIWTALEDWDEHAQWWVALSGFLDARATEIAKSAN